MKEQNITAALIYINSLDELLLQKKTNDYPPGPWAGGWFTIGGAVERGEHSYEAMLREVGEELGVDESHFKKISLWLSEDYYVPFYDTGGKAYVFRMDRENRNLDDFRIGEGAGIAYFHISEISSLKMLPLMRGWANKFIEETK